ncbi:MAG TPA: lipopolysaccharide heptosyltransferase II, partial [Telluria sp.]|nr:lipopolysaccharide heptosyltransferase II [Telluria sp.]
YAALADAPDAPLAQPPRPRMRVDEEARRGACAKAGIDASRPYVVFAPGAEFGSAKRWPARHFAALAASLRAGDPDLHVAMLGSPKDRAAGEEVLALAGPERLLNLAGTTRLDEAIALIAGAAAVVANDSGLLHVASALNRPVIALYGPTDPDHAPPFSDQARSISLRLDCSPCRQRECPLGHHNCMNQLDPALVLSALDEISAVVPGGGHGFPPARE